VNNKYFRKAKEKIGDPRILSLIAAKRAKQLALGAKPMVRIDEDEHLDIALYEIAEGLLGYNDGIVEDAADAFDELIMKSVEAEAKALEDKAEIETVEISEEIISTEENTEE